MKRAPRTLWEAPDDLKVAAHLSWVGLASIIIIVVIIGKNVNEYLTFRRV